MLRRVLIALLACGALGAVAPAVSQADQCAPTYGPAYASNGCIGFNIQCTWGGCDGAGNYTQGITDPYYVDAGGCELIFNENKFKAGLGAAAYMSSCFFDDTDPSLNQTSLNTDCDSGNYRLIIVGIPQFSARRWSCPSGDAGHTYIINAQEWYPYWDTGGDGDEVKAGANDDEQQLAYPSGFSCTWGWVTQHLFGWPAGQETSWSNPAPTSTQYTNEWNTLQNNCWELGHQYTLSDGNWGSGVEMEL